MTIKKNAIHHMTWKEIDQEFKNDPVVIIPLGSMEEHGPHSITGDFLAATEIAKRVAEKTDSLYVPTIPFGCSEYFRGFPGTISLSPETVLAVISDVCQSLTEHGITKIVLLNGHAGNGPTIDQVARKIRREKGLSITSVNLWQSLSPEFKKDLYGADFDPSGHGGEPLTSVMMYLHPEDMRMDLLDKVVPNKTWNGLPVKGLANAKLNDANVSVYLNMEDISEEGVMGNPLAASPERGEKIVNRIVDFCEEFINLINNRTAVKN